MSRQPFFCMLALLIRTNNSFIQGSPKNIQNCVCFISLIFFQILLLHFIQKTKNYRGISTFFPFDFFVEKPLKFNRKTTIMLDVVIGLVFMFLLLSLLITIVQEMIAGWLSLRGRRLERAVRNLLSPHFRDRNPRLLEVVLRKVLSNFLYIISFGYSERSKNDRHDKLEEWKKHEHSNDMKGWGESLYKVWNFLASLFDFNEKRDDPVTLEKALWDGLKNKKENKTGPQLTEKEIEAVFEECLYDKWYLNKKPGHYYSTQKAATALHHCKTDEEHKRCIKYLFLADHFFESPMYRQLIGNERHRQPSYMNSERFVSILIQFFAGETKLKEFNQHDAREAIQHLPVGDLKDSLTSFINDSKSIDDFKMKLSAWYDNAMERVSGRFKRYMQRFTFYLGLFLAIVFNANTFEVYSKLSVDTEARAAIIGQATSFLNENKDLLDGLNNQNQTNWGEQDSLAAKELSDGIDSIRKETKEVITNSLDEFSNSIGLGWENGVLDWDLTKKEGHWIPIPFIDRYTYQDSKLKIVLSELCRGLWGWLVTALAISLGAPFWFDMLNKLINIRNAGQVAQRLAQNSRTVELKEGQEVRDKAVG